MDKTQFLYAAGAGLVAQVVLVVCGHFVGFVADNLFAPGGALIALTVGTVYARHAPSSRPLMGASAAGAASAFAGILVSFLLGDVPGFMLVVGTLAAALAGLAGGALGLGLRARRKPG